MRTKAHWELCKNLTSYHAAQHIGLQLKELARQQGLHPNGVKILSKQETHANGKIADAQVTWSEGPINWTHELALSVPGVWTEAEDPFTLSFYEM